MLLRSPLRPVLRSPLRSTFGFDDVWSPLDLFADGEHGGLYSSSALDTLFQDENGTTPAVPGSPVGLVLDARQERVPVTLTGPSNGTTYKFSTITANGLDVTAVKDPSGFAGLSYDMGSNAPVGTLFEVEFDLVINSGSTVKVVLTQSQSGSGINQSNTTALDTGHHVLRLTTVTGDGSGVNRYLQFGGADTTYNFSLTNLKVSRVPGNHLSQPTTAARPILARMPLTGRRNLYPSTDMSGVSLFTSNVTVGGKELSLFTGDGAGAPISPAYNSGFTDTDIPIGCIRAVKGTGTRIMLGFTGTATGQNYNATFDFDTGTFPFVGSLLTAHAVHEDDGVWRLWVRFKNPISNTFALRGLRVRAGDPDAADNQGYIPQVGETYIWGMPQVDVNVDEPTPYQHVRSAYDITEAGVQSVYSLVYDLADDALTTTLPQAINGDILIAGTKGSIIEPVSYAAGSTFTIGPDTYTGGTPGVLSAVGDIVGLVLIDRTLTQNERDNLLSYYAGKGAGGLLP